MPERFDGEGDRRRSPRFSCGGQAEINCLPSTGVIVPGTLRDLSLHGCRVEITRPIDCGARAEIIVHVKAASFRALGTVRAIRGRSDAGVEFVQLSAGGKEKLEELMAELARSQALLNRLKCERRERDEEAFRRELEEGRLHAGRLSERFPFLQTILSSEKSEYKAKTEQAKSSGENCRVATLPLIVNIDLFG